MKHRKHNIRKIKVQRHVLYRNLPVRNSFFCFGGTFLLEATEEYCLFPKQIDWLRQWWEKALKGYAVRIFVRCSANKPFTQKAKQARMGKGKGKIKAFFFPVVAGTVLLELKCLPVEQKKNVRVGKVKKGKKADLLPLTLTRLHALVRLFTFKWGESFFLRSSLYKNGSYRNSDCNSR